MPTVTYQGESTVETMDASLSLLDISRQNGIPHLEACGGFGRCSTCRIVVLEGAENLTPPNEIEGEMASRKKFERNIRLACQTRTKGPVVIRRLVLDQGDADLALLDQSRTSGREIGVAVLFSDIRNFTPFAESNLSYDVVHILNRYFYRMGNAILQHQGYIDKYLGDGIMALFGLEGTPPATSCENALLAALEMKQELADFNKYLGQHFGLRFEIGIGIHYGDVLVGDMGHPQHQQFTAIGDAVNVAARIETATKEVGTTLLVSQAVVDQVGPRFQVGRTATLSLKGKSLPCPLFEITGMKPEFAGQDARPNLSQRIRLEMERWITTERAPGILRLVFHDAFTFNPATGEGGANGSIRFPEERAMPHNQGLDETFAIMDRLKQNVPDASYADLLALAGAFAVERCGGPKIAIEMGRRDAEQPLASLPPMPSEQDPVATLADQFARAGFSRRQLVVLSGAHTLGMGNGKPFTPDPYRFTNSYFRLLMENGDAAATLLPSDRVLLDDAECRRWIEVYAANEQAFFADFTDAYQQLTHLGMSPTAIAGS